MLIKNIISYLFAIFILAFSSNFFAQVANDNCTSAQAITIPSSGNVCVTSTTVNALSDNTTNTCDTGTPGNEVWFTFIATGSQNTVTVTPTGSPAIQQAVVSIDGTGCADAAYNICAVSATNNGAATATWTFTPGTQVWISVESNNGTQGGFQLCVTSVTPPPSPGSSCATATPLCNLNNFTLNPFPGNNNSFSPQCFGGNLQQPVFYQFTVGQTGTLQWTADVQGTAEYDWAFYNITGGCPGNNTTPLACNYNYASGNSNIIGMQAGPGTCSGEFCDPVTVTAGQTYMLIIDNYSNNGSGFIMSFAGSTFLMAPTAQFTVNPSTACGSANVTITNTSVAASSYNWNFGNGNTSNAQNPPAQTYSTPGTYLISLTTSSAAGCTNVTSQSVTVNANHTITASANQTLCAGTALTSITMTLGGGATGATAAGLPPGVTSSVSAGVVTLSGTPTTAGTYNYTVTTTGNSCTVATATGTITVNAANTVSAASSNPTICQGAALSNITFTTTGATGIETATGLPAGVTASFSGNTITISGTPTATGTFNYTIPLTGGCGTINATGTITINPNNTVGSASSTPALCVNTAISPDITFSTTGATGIGTATGLPAGVTATFSGSTITVSGTPTTTGIFNYTIPLTGGCGTISATGTITINTSNTVSSASSNPAICLGTAISPDITFTTTGATGIGTPTNLPTGVTATFSGNTITVSGTPTATGTFNYTIPLTGGCGTINATGTITISDVNTVSSASSNPTLCINTSISPVITFSTTIASGIGAPTGIPTGVNATFSSNTITVSGTPTAAGTFNYSIPLTGGCGTVNATGTITVNPSLTPTFNSWGPFCQNDILAQVMLPNSSNNGVTGTWNPGMLSTSAAGTINYVFTPDANQCAVSYNMNIVVNPLVQPTFTQLGPYCQNGIPGILNGTSNNSPGITGAWNTSLINTTNIGTTTYTFTPDPGQCASSTTMDIVVNSTPSPLITPDLTSGCTPLTVNLSTNNLPNTQYNWLVNGNSISNTQNTTYTFTQGGCYDIELQVSSNGCSSSSLENDLICVENIPTASFNPSTTLFLGNSQNINFTNNSVGATTYVWEFGDQTTSTLENPSHLYSNVNGNMLVTLIASSSLGCIDEYSVVINYQEQTVFYVPNTFTPDQDEYNQTWGPIFTQGFDPFHFDLFIYNRWGELIWESHDADARWDGSYGGLGTDCQEGIYTWKINYKPIETDEKRVVVGHVNLIR
ncbi:MAG: putative adhesin [Bacteroidota bacterium]|jgi:gliding motility-associated-like protein